MHEPDHSERDVDEEHRAPAAMVEDANAAFPSLRLRADDVLLVHSGLAPARVRRGRADLLPDHVVIDHSAHGHAGVFTLVGVKFTTARLAATDALHQMGLAGRSTQSSNAVAVGPQLLLHGGSENALPAIEAAFVECNVTVDDEVVEHLVDWYGTEAAEVLAWRSTVTMTFSAGRPSFRAVASRIRALAW